MFDWNQTSFVDLKWFHPECDRHSAESLLLLNGEDGSYLLRPSSRSHELALSVRWKETVRHFPVEKVGNKYKFGMLEYVSATEFCDHIKDHPVLGGESGQIMVLKYPYPRDVQEPGIYETVRTHGLMGKQANCIPSIFLDTSTKEGCLTKLGGLVKNWKLRWFVLGKDELRYYRRQSDPQPLRVLDLHECTECSKDSTFGSIEHSFRLVFPTRTFFLYASTETDAQEWITLIQWKLHHLQK